MWNIILKPVFQARWLDRRRDRVSDRAKLSEVSDVKAEPCGTLVPRTVTQQTQVPFQLALTSGTDLAIIVALPLLGRTRLRLLKFQVTFKIYPQF